MTTPRTDGQPAGGVGQAFPDPVLDSQGVFRTLLTALSEPGRSHRLTQAVLAPAALHAASACVLLTLADFETPVWLAPELGAEAEAWVRFHCGAPIASEPAAAAIAVLDGSRSGPGLDAFDGGDERYPDKSATLIVQTTALTGGTDVTLVGPGIRDATSLSPRGLRPGFWSEVAANHARYPLGVDLLLVAGDALAGLPRSTTVTVADGKGAD